MQTSLSRRQARRLNGGRRQRGGGAGRKVAVALPLFLFGTFVFVALIGFVGAVGAYAYFSQGLADPHVLDQLTLGQQSTIYDRTGKIQLATFGQVNRQDVSYAQIPPVMIDATTSIEDKTFWTNAGFDPLGIVSAAIDTLQGQERGASTITQQLVRDRLLDPALVANPNLKVERKIKEIIQSIRLTEAFPGTQGKEQIMRDYLNSNFYGNNSYGIKAAAESYFGLTDLSKMTLAEAAILAGIPQSPTDYDLVRNAVKQKNGELVVPATAPIVQRRNYILQLMETRSVLTKGQYTAADYEAAMQSPVILAPQKPQRWIAPQFDYQVQKQLADELCGPGVATCPRLEKGGLKVITTLDYPMQLAAQQWTEAATIVPQSKNPAAEAKAIGLPYQQWMKNLVGQNVHNGALMAMDYQTGEVLAYQGSADYYSPDATPQFQPQFDVLSDGWRQIGSSFKPFNYVTGINDHTMTAATLFMDVSTDFGGGYQPHDADMLERGPVRLRQALEFSLNIPAVKALAYNGVDHVFQMAEKFGLRFQTTQPTAGLSLTLGTQVVHVADLDQGYSTLANNGVYTGRTFILQVLDSQGQNVVNPYTPPAGTPVVTPQAAYIIGNVLAGNTDPNLNPYWGAFRIMAANGHRRPAALKTGTNDSAGDLIAAGFTAPPTAQERQAGSYALAVVAWNGNSDNSPVGKLLSFDVPTFVWQGFLTQVTKDWPIDNFPVPSGIVQRSVDAWSGMLPGPFTTHTFTENFIEGTQPTQADNTKVPMQVVEENGKDVLWQPGCQGTPVTKGFLDLSNVETAFPNWHQADLAWIARAEKGPGVASKAGTRTTYFYNPYFQPYGKSWGAPFPPTQTCTPAPSPSPVPSGFPPGSFEPGASGSPGSTPPVEPTGVVPDVVGKNVVSAQAQILAAGFRPQVSGSGSTVTAQNPPGGTQLGLGSVIQLQT